MRRVFLLNKKEKVEKEHEKGRDERVI